MNKSKFISVTTIVISLLIATPSVAHTNNAGSDSTAINDSTHLLQEVTVELNAFTIKLTGCYICLLPHATQDGG